MFVVRSNRVEALVEGLAQTLETPLEDPFASETIVVQSRGTAAWLAMQLARRFGIWAGAEFPFPRRFLHGLFGTVVGAAPVDAFAAPHLLWSVLAELPEHMGHQSFAELERYMREDASGRQRFQLAQRVAQVFDRYGVHRPDTMLRWEAGEHDDWQARLWRALCARIGSHHPGAIAREFLQTLEAPTFDPSVLPPRICVFGVSTLPPLYVHLFAALARHRPVHLFVISPSREYWGDTRSARATLREASRGASTADLVEDAPPLLAALGSVGREFQSILESSTDYRDTDRYVDPAMHASAMHASAMLEVIQSDLLNLRHRGRPGDALPHAIAATDRSIAVHSCHSPMREVEVLHDQLLGWFAEDRDLQPHHVIVMMSDLEQYAPLVEAVFERDPNDPTYIPYSIADRSLRHESPTIEALHRVLELVGSRVVASTILDLLMLDPIAERFDIAPKDVDLLTRWVTESGVRWGIDADHRREHAQPAFDENTWQFGLRRLLVGYAMPTAGRAMWSDTLPYDEIEGQEAELLGRLTDLCHTLFTAVESLAAPRPVRAWQTDLTALLDNVFAGPERSARDLRQLRTILQTLADEADAAGFTGPLELEAMRVLIDERLEDDLPARGFLAGGVTFCAMLPMRSIPFEVVCVLGLSEEQFPRPTPKIGFDLLARAPRPGDRSRRADDRYLFLEAILAARKRLLLFYVGQDIRDNSAISPSVVVQELLDELGRGFLPPDRDRPDASALARHVVVRHPMQPFSPRYFGADPDPRLFSYARGYVGGARALLDPRERIDQPPLFVERLPPPAPVVTLTLKRLIDFFRQPTAELLKSRLGVNLTDWQRDRSDREPMELNELERWRVGTTMLEHMLHEEPLDGFPLLRAGGALPLGTTGRCRYDDLVRSVDPIARALETYRRAPRLPDLPFDLDVSGIRLQGSLPLRWPAALNSAQFSKLSAKHLLAAWIRHLVLCALAPSDQACRTIVVSRPEKGAAAHVTTLHPVQEPQQRLARLIELYLQGQREPLLLFPRTSWVFCRTFDRTEPFDRKLSIALEESKREWSDRHSRPEQDDPHLRRVFGTRDVLTPTFRLFGPEDPDGLSFVELAIAVFEPLLRHMEES